MFSELAVPVMAIDTVRSAAARSAALSPEVSLPKSSATGEAGTASTRAAPSSSVATSVTLCSRAHVVSSSTDAISTMGTAKNDPVLARTEAGS